MKRTLLNTTWTKESNANKNFAMEKRGEKGFNGFLPTSWDIAGHETKRMAQKNEINNIWRESFSISKKLWFVLKYLISITKPKQVDYIVWRFWEPKLAYIYEQHTEIRSFWVASICASISQPSLKKEEKELMSYWHLYHIIINGGNKGLA